MSPQRVAVVLVLLPLVSGCSLAPDPVPPAIAAPEAWRAEAAPGGAPIADGWWRAFGDAELTALVEAALESNRELLAAIARVDEARALARIAGADRLPSVELGASSSRSRSSEATGTLPPGADATASRHRLAAALAFELDLFGRVRNATEAARRRLLAAESTRDAVELAVASEVASAWFELAALDRQAEVLEATVASRRRAEELIEARFRGGQASRLDYERARAERAAAEAERPRVERARRATENRLALLAGRMPGEAPRGRSIVELAAPAVPAGLPSELLARRPDVAVAESLLAAAAADVGAARAALFPSIRLTGAWGRESAELSDLFSPGAVVWNAAAGLLQPIFRGGRNRAGVAAAEARQRQAVAVYLATAEGAFRDVEDALFGVGTTRARRTALAEQVAALASAYELARLRYEEGESSLLEVLDVERQRLAAELGLAEARRDELAAAVALFRALGGGWSAEGVSAPAPRP